MKRTLIPASAAALTAVAAIPTMAAAQPTTRSDARAYEQAYHAVAHRLGERVPGRNIVRDRLPDGRRPSDAQTVHSLGVLQRMLGGSSTAGGSDVSGTAGGADAAAGSADTGGAAGVPACASESGTNYSTGSSNTNPSSGATGRYQILPSTAAAYGCDLATAAGQDACAQTIYAHQGAGAWVGCGG